MRKRAQLLVVGGLSALTAAAITAGFFAFNEPHRNLPAGTARESGVIWVKLGTAAPTLKAARYFTVHGNTIKYCGIADMIIPGRGMVGALVPCDSKMLKNRP